MTADDLAIISRAITPVLRDFVAAKLQSVEDRVAAVEARSPIPGEPGAPGPPGERGEKGEPGESGARGVDGHDGQDVDPTLLTEIRTTLATLTDAWQTHHDRHLSVEHLEAQASELCEKAFALAWTAAEPPVRQKRVIRDRAGRIDRIIEEPVA